jgi:predicted amidohydrolase YtcJ
LVIDGNEIADQLALQGSSHPPIPPEPTQGISAKAAKKVIWGWTSRKHKEYWQLICGQKQAKGFLKRTAAKRAQELLNLSRNHPGIMAGLLTGHTDLRGHLFRRIGKQSWM